MAEIVLFHHSQGLTPGVRAFADDLTAAGHTVHVPDLFEGRMFDDVESGVAHAREIGFDTVLDRGVAAAEAFPAEVVYAGFSMGVMPAQKLTQTRPGATGALFVDACLPVEEFGSWPDGVPVQVHGGVDDEWFAEDLESARALVGSTPTAELFLYSGTAHLFADSSLQGHDPAAAGLLRQRTLAFLASL
ncbi:dienelactone hydrolase family protein [Krasilnikoviella flava]|uniref:Dienelactone hydrolase n=1 Tax=Krasilnikoviella flava TaxID=526729 RepID=A0A1T5JL63_9MICO|nr:dienelactone hydrolase family protein [Krasilnikoviella flava]SKC52190.1 Dienelactone hydrolase [Krasilnikoviella flava]